VVAAGGEKGGGGHSGFPPPNNIVVVFPFPADFTRCPFMSPPPSPRGQGPGRGAEVAVRCVRLARQLQFVQHKLFDVGGAAGSAGETDPKRKVFNPQDVTLVEVRRMPPPPGMPPHPPRGGGLSG